MYGHPYTYKYKKTPIYEILNYELTPCFVYRLHPDAWFK